MAETLKSTIDNDIKEAMRAKDKDALKALRAIKSLILLEETKEGGDGAISTEAEMALLNKAAKQRKDSAAIYKEQNRPDLEEEELKELAIIERYLPKQMSDEELTSSIKEIVEEVGAKSPADMGKVMGVASKKLSGKADNKRISEQIKAVLSSL